MDEDRLQQLEADVAKLRTTVDDLLHPRALPPPPKDPWQTLQKTIAAVVEQIDGADTSLRLAVTMLDTTTASLQAAKGQLETLARVLDEEFDEIFADDPEPDPEPDGAA
jgi:hypothetical protein